MAETIVAYVKKDCETCVLIQPVLQQLVDAGVVSEVVSQDPDFPKLETDGTTITYDETLERSWRADIDTAPTLIKLTDGNETDRTIGWHRDNWEALTGATSLGPDLPAVRPGCGSKNVDPDIVDSLNAQFGEATTSSRRVEFAALEDPFEAMFDRGWSDGLPLVPPTPERVERMLAASTRSPGDVVAVVPPNLVDATVEKVAINAVMAGCKPEYLPVVLAGIEAICNDEFNMHGVLATTMGVGPILVVNGPISRELNMNSGMNVFGQGNRANSTIGRAVQLCVRNIGGGRPGEIDRSTQGQPGKLGLAFAEDEAGSPWPSLAEARGFTAEQNTVTAFCGEAPRIIFDQMSRTAESLTASIAETMLANVSRRVTGFDTLLTLCPEHLARYTEAGWSREQFETELRNNLNVEVDTILRGVGDIGEGIPPGMGFEGMELPKFREGGILITHAGGPAGLFSSVFGGWVSGDMGSVPVTKEITR